MAASTELRSGLFYGWPLGEQGWNTGMDANLLRLGRFGFHLSVKSRQVSTPPASPAASDTYIVGPSATGAWGGNDGKLTLWDGAAWVFATPRKGYSAWIEDQELRMAFGDSDWQAEVTSYTDEQARDAIGAALTTGPNLSVTVDDPGDTIKIETAFDKAEVYINTAANSTAAGTQKVPFDAVNFDTNSIWDTTNKRFIPKKAGYYQVNVRVRLNTANTIVMIIGKNGVAIRALGPNAGTTSFASGGSDLVYCNGTTDYIEAFIYTTVARAYTNTLFDSHMSIVGPF